MPDLLLRIFGEAVGQLEDDIKRREPFHCKCTETAVCPPPVDQQLQPVGEQQPEAPPLVSSALNDPTEDDLEVEFLFAGDDSFILISDDENEEITISDSESNNEPTCVIDSESENSDMEWYVPSPVPIELCTSDMDWYNPSSVPIEICTSIKSSDTDSDSMHSNYMSDSQSED